MVDLNKKSAICEKKKQFFKGGEESNNYKGNNHSIIFVFSLRIYQNFENLGKKMEISHQRAGFFILFHTFSLIFIYFPKKTNYFPHFSKENPIRKISKEGGIIFKKIYNYVNQHIVLIQELIIVGYSRAWMDT